jgi:hypothetical protein
MWQATADGTLGRIRDVAAPSSLSHSPKPNRNYACRIVRPPGLFFGCRAVVNHVGPLPERFTLVEYQHGSASVPSASTGDR